MFLPFKFHKCSHTIILLFTSSTVSLGCTFITQINFCSLVTIRTLQVDSLIWLFLARWIECDFPNILWIIAIIGKLIQKCFMSLEVSDQQYDTIRELCITLIMSNKTLGTKEASRFPNVPYNTVQHIYRFNIHTFLK